MLSTTSHRLLSNKLLIALTIVLIYRMSLMPLAIFAQPPAGYYNGTEGLTGTPLQAKLHSIIKDHNAVTYSSIYEHFQQTDKKSNNTVWDMYSDTPGANPPYVYHFNSDECGNYNSEGDCFNREHSWPSSWFNDQMPMRTDLFHIYPTDGYVNNRRSNYPFSVVGSTTWVSLNGSRLGYSNYPGYSDLAFEPIDEYKGDFARTYFYMATRYYQEDNGWVSNGMVNGSQLKDWAADLLMEWHTQDPVSEKENLRNNAVYFIQNNRNPFIDQPLFADRIWGGATGTNNLNTIVFRIEPNPVSSVARIYFSATVPAQTELQIIDLTQRVVYRKMLDSDSPQQIFIENLKPGVYFVRIGGTFCTKLIKN